MSDIDLYTSTPRTYEDLQHKRPDYVGAQKEFNNLALKYLKGAKSPFIVDFCCGTGQNSLTLSKSIPISQAILIDINPTFLNIAEQSGFECKLKTICSDILSVSLKPENDLVISMFAYHHVSDTDKEKYINKAHDALKIGGILLIGEIYSPDKKTTIAYYNELIRVIDKKDWTPELEKFLSQTAHSDDFEYKVSREFAHAQLSKHFDLIEEKRIWPTDNDFDNNIGTFIEVWRKK